LSRHKKWSRNDLLKIECDDDHLRLSLVDGVCEDELIGVGEVVSLLVDDVGEPIGELDFRDELEERPVEITAESRFQIAVEAVEQQVFLFFHGQVVHRIHTHHGIRTVVVEPLAGDFQVDRQGDIGGLHVLDFRSVVEVVDELHVLRPEMHGRNDAQREVVVQAVFRQHAHAESRLVVGCVGIPVVAVLIHESVVHELDVLEMDTGEESVVELPLVNIRTVHHLTLLGVGRRQHHNESEGCQNQGLPKAREAMEAEGENM